MAARTWTCQRRSDGVKCAHVNPKKLQKCARCGKRRPATKRPAHMSVLDEWPYERCVEVFGEKCGICGAPPKPGKKLQRDHDHRTGRIRGLLCFRDNHQLPSWMTLEWMERATAYLRRAEEFPQ